MTTKIEFAARLQNAGVALPENWGKLSTNRAKAWMENALADVYEPSVSSHSSAPEPKPQRSRRFGLAGAAAAVMGAVVGHAFRADVPELDALSPADKAEARRFAKIVGKKQATMPKNPRWKRSNRIAKSAWFVYPAAKDPVPMTRQVKRQNERRENRMPIGASQAVWHRSVGYPAKIGNGKIRRALGADA